MPDLKAFLFVLNAYLNTECRMDARAIIESIIDNKFHLSFLLAFWCFFFNSKKNVNLLVTVFHLGM